MFNTHLDHISDEARINGIRVVLDKIAQFGGKPSIIMGDFNAKENSETYKMATETLTTPSTLRITPTTPVHIRISARHLTEAV